MTTLDIEPLRGKEPIFRIAYEGPALDDHEIDASDLAAALLAIGQMVRAANRLVNGDRLEVRVRVRGAGAGSFWIELSVQAAGLWGMVADLVTGRDTDAILKLLEIAGIVGVTGKGAIALVRSIGGRRVSRITRKGQAVEIETEDGGLIPADEAAARVALDQTFRKALENVVVAPLLKEGVDACVISGDGVSERVTPGDMRTFSAPMVDVDIIEENIYPKIFSIDTLSFRPGKKWRLSDGHGRSMLVDVEDGKFIDRIERSEIRFAKGDLLYCDVRETTRQTSKGMRAQFSIIHVREHRPPPGGRQSTMDI